MAVDWVTPLYKGGAALFRTLPRSVSEPLAETTYAAVSKLSEERRLLVTRNLRRVRGQDFDGPELEAALRTTFESYGRYWVDSFRLPKVTPPEIDFGFAFEGVEHIARGLAESQGGSLRHAAREGGGSVFSLTLPAADLMSDAAVSSDTRGYA